MIMEWLLEPETWIALLTLTALEIVLGIDNIIFISILAEKLPKPQVDRGRRVGLLGAMFTRILLLFSLVWLIRLADPLFSIFGHPFSGRDLILIAGGLFLLGKSTIEIHDKLEGKEGHAPAKSGATFLGVVVQIMLLDIVFSLDSVITAVGMARQLPVMVAAVVIAVMIMLYASGPISKFVGHHPTIRILALSFLLLIGVSLVADGLTFHIPKGYIYFAMGFSVFVEMLNLRLRRIEQPPVKLRQLYLASSNGDDFPMTENRNQGKERPDSPHSQNT
jgi:predicted tellurium resistance membrane protein TerC